MTGLVLFCELLLKAGLPSCAHMFSLHLLSGLPPLTVLPLPPRRALKLTGITVCAAGSRMCPVHTATQRAVGMEDRGPRVCIHVYKAMDAAVEMEAQNASMSTGPWTELWRWRSRMHLRPQGHERSCEDERHSGYFLIEAGAFTGNGAGPEMRKPNSST